MKGFVRSNQLLSLCGLNCGLCPMFLGNHCGGCGAGNQTCAIARCSLEQGGIEYCYQCASYPCARYAHIDDYDSFITHKRQKEDLERAQKIGIDNYNLEQEEKMQILGHLLANYNDGRRKNFFCVAVNLLALAELHEGLHQIEANTTLPTLPIKEKSAYVAALFATIASRRNVQLRLNKKK